MSLRIGPTPKIQRLVASKKHLFADISQVRVVESGDQPNEQSILLEGHYKKLPRICSKAPAFCCTSNIYDKRSTTEITGDSVEPPTPGRTDQNLVLMLSERC